jgi:phosphomannomutase
MDRPFDGIRAELEKRMTPEMAKRIACEFCNRIFDNDSDYNHHLIVIHHIDAWD